MQRWLKEGYISKNIKLTVYKIKIALLSVWIANKDTFYNSRLKLIQTIEDSERNKLN